VYISEMLVIQLLSSFITYYIAPYFAFYKFSNLDRCNNDSQHLRCDGQEQLDYLT